MFTNLVEDNEYRILSFLNAKELCSASKVNKAWYEKTVQDKVWGIFFKKIPLLKGMTFKAHFNKNGVISTKALMARILNFSQKIGKEQNGEFYCHFPQNTNCYLALKIWNNQNKKEFFHITEQCWFLETFPLTPPLSDTITIDRSHQYMLHIRIPKKLAISNQITAILNAHEPLVRSNSRNFKACTRS